MIDIRLIRENPDWVKGEIAKLNAEAPIDEILDLDQQRRQALSQVEELKAERNRVSKSMGPLRGRITKAKDNEKAQLEAEFEATRQQMGAVNEQIKALDDSLRDIDAQL
jgi:seryl-tRNA synthetase